MVAASLPIIYLNILTISVCRSRSVKMFYAVKLGINMKAFSVIPYERAETDLDNNFQMLYVLTVYYKNLSDIKWINKINILEISSFDSLKKARKNFKSSVSVLLGGGGCCCCCCLEVFL